MDVNVGPCRRGGIVASSSIAVKADSRTINPLYPFQEIHARNASCERPISADSLYFKNGRFSTHLTA
jgi:hypothetical protein